jgi:hypothetical protein
LIFRWKRLKGTLLKHPMMPTSRLFIYNLLSMVKKADGANTQTVTFGNAASTPTQMPSSTPAVPELSWLTLLPLFTSAFFIAVLRYRKAKTKLD